MQFLNMPVAAATIAKRKETMEKNKLAGVVRKPRAPMSTEAKAIMAAKRKHTILLRTQVSQEQPPMLRQNPEQQKQEQRQPEQQQLLHYHDLINDPTIKKNAYFHLFELERTKGVLPFEEYTDSLMKNVNLGKNVAEHFTVHFIVLNQSIKVEYGVNQPDPRLAFMFTGVP
jgi:hypothetical protein